MKTTKRSLLTTAICLLLTAVMLLGSTFAWFTDSVTNTGNKIEAGKLDVELWNGNTNITNETDPVFDYSLWEPGYSTGASLTVKNVGTLAVKYELELQKVTTTNGIEKVIDVYVNEVKLGTLADFMNGENLAEGTLEANTSSGVFAVKLAMQTSAGNDYQGAVATFDILLKATQASVESEKDGFGNSDYDANAQWPEEAAGTTSGTATVEIPAAGETATLVIPGGKVTVPAGASFVEDATELTLEVEPGEIPEDVTVDPYETAVAYEISLEGLAEDNNAPITVELYVGKGLENVKLYHYANLVENAKYDSNTGIITFTTTSFSPFTVVSGPVVIDSNEDLVNAILNQADNQTWLFTKAGTYDAKNTQGAGNYVVPAEVYSYPFALPIYANNITITKAAGVGEVVLTSSYTPSKTSGGNWHDQNFITVYGTGFTVDGITLKANTNLYYGTCNKLIELCGSAKDLTLKNVNVIPVENSEGTSFGGSIYFNVTDAGNTVIENLTMDAWISASKVEAGTIAINGLTQDFSNSEYAGYYYEGYGYAWNPTVNGSYSGITVKDYTIIVDDRTNLNEQVFNDNLRPNTTVVLKDGTYDVTYKGAHQSENHYLWLNKDGITVMGAEGENPVLTAKFTGTMNGNEQQTVLITAANVTLKNLSIEMIDGYENKTVELRDNASNVVIEDCLIYGNLYIGGPNVGSYTIKDNLFVEDEISIVVANGAGNAMADGEKAVITGNSCSGALFLTGTRNNGWDKNELTKLPEISDNTFGKFTQEVDGVSYTHYIRVASTVKENLELAVDAIKADNVFDGKTDGQWSYQDVEDNGTWYRFYN